MHGRVKTITTEEQKLKAEKAKQVKMEFYVKAMKRITEKRENDEHDDEALTITRDVLLNNPDIITLWNYRREIFLTILKTESEEELAKTLKSELSLTEMCLRINPKSYGTWHYRIWLLDNFPGSDWKKEWELCNKYLSLDERNFHCWDYRRLVVGRAQIPAIDEFNFTTSKIETNFSNYSAWHYRSKLLPKLFPDPHKIFPIAEEKHKSELELVQNAAFTDPDDQSAWFYLRWLLGLRNTGSSFICAQIKSSKVFVAFTDAINLSKQSILEFWINAEKIPMDWVSVSGRAYSPMWSTTLPKDISDEDTITVKHVIDDEVTDLIEVRKREPTKRAISFASANSSGLVKTFEEQLRSCEELLELEPDSKWPLLTSIFLMRSLNAIKYHSKILSSINKLTHIDLLRTGYYSDLLSRIEIEHKLLQSGFEDHLDLSNKNLTNLYHSQYLMLAKTVNLSNNKLRNNDLVKLYSLINCTDLTLVGNQVTQKKLPNLESIKNLQI